jgi:hypothetical protein
MAPAASRKLGLTIVTTRRSLVSRLTYSSPGSVRWGGGGVHGDGPGDLPAAGAVIPGGGRLIPSPNRNGDGGAHHAIPASDLQHLGRLGFTPDPRARRDGDGYLLARGKLPTHQDHVCAIASGRVGGSQRRCPFRLGCRSGGNGGSDRNCRCKRAGGGRGESLLLGLTSLGVGKSDLLRDAWVKLALIGFSAQITSA